MSLYSPSCQSSLSKGPYLRYSAKQAGTMPRNTQTILSLSQAPASSPTLSSTAIFTKGVTTSDSEMDEPSTPKAVPTDSLPTTLGTEACTAAKQTEQQAEMLKQKTATTAQCRADGWEELGRRQRPQRQQRQKVEERTKRGRRDVGLRLKRRPTMMLRRVRPENGMVRSRPAVEQEKPKRLTSRSLMLSIKPPRVVSAKKEVAMRTHNTLGKVLSCDRLKPASNYCDCSCSQLQAEFSNAACFCGSPLLMYLSRMVTPAISAIPHTPAPKAHGTTILFVLSQTRVVTSELRESMRKGRLRATAITTSKLLVQQRSMMRP